MSVTDSWRIALELSWPRCFLASQRGLHFAIRDVHPVSAVSALSSIVALALGQDGLPAGTHAKFVLIVRSILLTLMLVLQTFILMVVMPMVLKSGVVASFCCKEMLRIVVGLG